MSKEYNLSDEQYNKLINALYSVLETNGLEYFDFSEDTEVNGRETLTSMMKNFEKRNMLVEAAYVRSYLESKVIGGIREEDYIETGKYINEMFNKKRLE